MHWFYYIYQWDKNNLLLLLLRVKSDFVWTAKNDWKRGHKMANLMVSTNRATSTQFPYEEREKQNKKIRIVFFFSFLFPSLSVLSFSQRIITFLWHPNRKILLSVIYVNLVLYWSPSRNYNGKWSSVFIIDFSGKMWVKIWNYFLFWCLYFVLWF